MILPKSFTHLSQLLRFHSVEKEGGMSRDSASFHLLLQGILFQLLKLHLLLSSM